MPRRRFTKKELRQYNGKGGAPVFIAYQGNVYDVSTRSYGKADAIKQPTMPGQI